MGAGQQSESAASRDAVKAFLRALGVGGTFTMQELREAVPNANQVDRRMRELRPAGWVIDTNRTDPTLSPGVYRFTTEGADTPGPAAVSNRIRREVFERDGNRCVLCGVAAGEAYPDEPTRVCRLTVGHLQAGGHGGASDLGNYRTECSRCNETVRDRTVTPPTVAEIVTVARNLTNAQKRQIAAWLVADRRDFTPVDELWARLRRLPPEYRAAVLEELRNFM